MNKAKQRQLVLRVMKSKYYGENKLDWMGYPITNDNKPSYHHIIKREELLRQGKSIDATVENGAYLGKRSHEMLHEIELIDHDLFECWNDLFLMINRFGCYPPEHVWNMVIHMKEISEDVLNEHKSSKRLIK